MLIDCVGFTILTGTTMKSAILDVTQYSWVDIHQRFAVKVGAQNVTSNFLILQQARKFCLVFVPELV
jgi:hypothetical protein